MTTTSLPPGGVQPGVLRANSRTSRFTRFLVTAFPTFLLTVMPRRPLALVAGATTTRKCLV